jgi:hypothetical protein
LDPQKQKKGEMKKNQGQVATRKEKLVGPVAGNGQSRVVVPGLAAVLPSGLQSTSEDAR